MDGSSVDPSPSASGGTVRRIVAAGPSLSFNDMTGGVSDLALHPTTRLPVVAYYDKSAAIGGTGATPAVGALKFAYMDASGIWNIEVVDANYGAVVCGTAASYCVGAPNAAAGATASIIRVAFKSDGTASIVYVYGASLNTAGGFKQIRLAERSSSGAWTISTVFSTSTAALASNGSIVNNIDAMKGLTLTFDSADRPHITFAFYGQTVVGNSAIKYSFRSSQGVWSTSDIVSAATGTATITAFTQGTMQAGAALCPANGRLLVTNQTIDAAGGVGQVIFSRCTAVDANGGCSAWSTLNLSKGCTGSTSCFSSGITTASNWGSRSDLVIDAATQRPVVGAYVTATPNNSLITVTAPNACDQAQPSTAGSWGAPVTVGGSNEGQNGFRLAASTSALNLNYVTYLDATTTLLTNKSTGPSGAWLATGATIESTTVGAEGLGFAYDATNDSLWTSYAATPANGAGTVGNDMKVSLGTSADVVNAGAAGPFVLGVVDSMVSLFPTVAVPTLSAAVAPNGTVGFTYFFQDSTVADSRLYYGIRGGSASSPVFSSHVAINHIDGGASPQFVGSYPSLTFDSNSNPVIAYYNGVTAEQNLQVAGSFNGGTSFSVTTVDESAANVGQYPSAATTGSTIGIAYYDVTNTGLKFARFSAGTGWRRFSVDGIAGTGSCGNASDDAGKYARLKFTSSGRPVIVYQSQGALKIAYSSSAASSTTHSWTCVPLDASGNLRGEGIALDLSASDQPHVAHFDSTAGAVRYVRCSDSIATCISTGVSAFQSELVSATGTVTTVSTQPGIRVTSADTVYLSFYSATSQALVLASRASTDSSWTLENLDQNSTGGSHVSGVGQYAALLLNSSEQPMLFYRSYENWLRYLSRE